MKPTPYYVLAIFVTLWALFGVCSCSNPAVLKIATPAVQAQVTGDLEKALIAGGGALLVTGGNGGAAIAAMTAQEVQNLPKLQAVIDNATPATTSGGTIPVIPSAPATQAAAVGKVTP
jgi:hypothetical protein